MNNYYQNPIFPNTNLNDKNIETYQNFRNTGYSDLPNDEMYLENILNLKKGKNARIHMTVPGTMDLQDKIFEGTINKVGRDYILLNNNSNGNEYLLVLPYLTYIEFI